MANEISWISQIFQVLEKWVCVITDTMSYVLQHKYIDS